MKSKQRRNLHPKASKSSAGRKDPRTLPQSITLSEGPRHILNHVLRYSLVRYSNVFNDARPLGLLRGREYAKLYDWADSLIDVSYEDATKHYVARQVSALIRKYPWGREDVPHLEPEKAARRTFGEAEERCRRTNLRFSRRSSLLRSRFYPLIEDMRRYIASVIGVEPNMERIYANCDFGTGASMGVHGGATNYHRKVLARQLTCTPTAYPYAVEGLWRNPHLSEFFLPKGPGGFTCYCKDTLAETLKEKIAWVTSNKISFVPKTAKTHRAIAVEPLLNGFVQRGIDTELRSLLERNSGRFLDFQTHNQLLAQEGSTSGAYSTIDLSSASDTVSTSMLYQLLPRAWFSLLIKARSQSYAMKGMKGEETFHKFTSMGNNFTFPLETLVFQAATRSAMKVAGVWGHETYSVYGDDIVVPTSANSLLMSLLRFLGFVPNPKKSFSSGPFRESCGADWYGGQDVRPVELDYHLSSPELVMIFHNACMRSPRTADFFGDLLPWLRDTVPEEARFMRPAYGPVVRGINTSLLDLKNLNGAFTVPYDIFMSSRHASWSRQEHRFRWKEFQFIPVLDVKARQELLSEDPYGFFDRLTYLAFLRGSPGGLPTLRYTAKRRIITK